MLNKIIMQNFTRIKTMPHKHHRKIFSLTATELELFVRKWVKLLENDYFYVKQFAGTGDLGRDVVGFCDKNLHQGVWDNYQCKQYGTTLNTDKCILEIAKTLYYAYSGEFTAPRYYYFVAPKGLNRKFETLIYNPNNLKKYLIENWDKYCKEKIISNNVIILNNELKNFILSFDFSNIKEIDINDMLDHRKIGFLLNEWFGHDLPEPPKGITPIDINKNESIYINKLFKCYESESNNKINNIDDIRNSKRYFKHFNQQRERFFCSDNFKRFYRESLYGGQIEELEDDIYDGIFEVLYDEHKNSFSKMNKTLIKSTSIENHGLLSKYLNSKIKQGICHHLANDDKIDWED